MTGEDYDTVSRGEGKDNFSCFVVPRGGMGLSFEKKLRLVLYTG